MTSALAYAYSFIGDIDKAEKYKKRQKKLFKANIGK